jgi:hypothetical protein
MTRRLLFALALVLPGAGAAWAQRLPCPEFQVNTYTTGDQYLTGLASDAAGNFVVVWADEDGYGHGRRFSPEGVALTPEFPLGRSGRVASDAAGNFVLLSAVDDGDYGGVAARRFDTQGSPLGPEFLVHSSTAGNQFFGSVAMGPTGAFVVVWNSTPTTGARGIFARLFDAAGVAQGPEFRVNSDTAADYYEGGPRVTRDATGRFTVVWSNHYYGTDSFGAVVGQRFEAAGVRLGPQFLVNTYTTYIQSGPTAASDPAGNVVVVWNSEGQDGDWEGTFGQRFDASGARLGPEFPVNTYTTQYQVLPTAAVAPDGSFLVAFRQANFGPSPEMDVRARRFTASGVPEGPDFLVNTYTPGYQGDALVAATGAGAFVVAWSSAHDGSGWGVFARVDCAQRFHTVTPCRLADTRQPPGQPLAANTSRSFPVAGACGVPADAGAVAVNATAVNPTDLGDLRLFPAGQSAPLASALNFIPGRTRANNAVVPLGADGRVTVQCDMPAGSLGATHLVLDVFGYFAR